MPRTRREPLPDLSLEQLREMMSALGVTQLLLKVLAPNDNSKNQPYLSGSLDVTNILPTARIYVDETDKGNRIMKAALPLEWLQPDGRSIPAPNAKLILYPQYPEVRFSGFLKGAVNSPNELMTTRMPGRILFMGITDDRRIIAWCVGPESLIARTLPPLTELEQVGVFHVLPLSKSGKSGRTLLLEQLKRIHLLGWIASKRLNRDGTVQFSAQNGIGFTLEAELGVIQNGRPDPDFEGWEVKASQVTNFARVPPATVITLMTPQPDGGLYKDDFHTFIRTYGYADMRGRPDRLNFGGVHRIGARHRLTSLTPTLVGFDVAKNSIEPDGKLVLVADDGSEAAVWSFAKLLEAWNHKHAQAAYIPGEVHTLPAKEYRYGNTIKLAEGTSFNLFLKALACGAVVYDPGIKLEGISGPKPKPKQRSQFRTSYQHLSTLYDKVTAVDVAE